jgi:predicted alpha-1,2-mannosidase
MTTNKPVKKLSLPNKHNAFAKKLVCLFICNSIFFSKAIYGQSDLTQYVDPYIGTGFHGHVFMGANVPFGAVQLGPTNISTGWDWCSGYHYSDSVIVGFSHTHLSGTGIGDLGDISVMPAIGDISPTKGRLSNLDSGYSSLFSHDEEIASPGYYSVRLKRYGVLAELTATARVGFHQYTFPASDKAQLIFDLKEGIGWDSPVETFIIRINDTTISGYRRSNGWAKDQCIYFAAVFSKPMVNFRVAEDSVLKEGNSAAGRHAKAIVYFTTGNGEKIMVKVGISPVSTQNALLNIREETHAWNFDQVAMDAKNAWDKELQKIRIKTNDESRKKVFYTALYHTMIAPSIFNDHNGDYFGTDRKIYRNASFTNLTTFSLWDTYRAAHPLFTLIQSQRVNDMINSMLAIYKQQGKLPIWHLMGNETNTMPGYSSVQVVADAYLKGFRGFDTAMAYEAVKGTSMGNERGLSFVKAKGYIPADSMVESVAMGLEYAIADYGIAQMAKKMNKQVDYRYYLKRANYYRNYFNTETRFVRGRISDKEWRTPFSPFVSRHMKDDFAEGNAWQYTWLVPQDVKGLISLLGGDKKFISKLDSLFMVKGDMGKDASADITGLIGQYAHGNEPSHHIIYLYAYAGQPWKTAEKARLIMDSFYAAKPAGLIGNEDVGQMSAWYVLSALGIYQVNPSGGVFVFGSPEIDEARFSLENGNQFHIIASNNSPANKYIQRIFLNGKPYTRSWISYADIMRGGELKFEMGNRPSVSLGVKPSDRPNN